MGTPLRSGHRGGGDVSGGNDDRGTDPAGSSSGGTAGVCGRESGVRNGNEEKEIEIEKISGEQNDHSERPAAEASASRRGGNEFHRDLDPSRGGDAEKDRREDPGAGEKTPGRKA